MGKTTSSSGSSKNQQQTRSTTISKVNHFQPQASSSASSSVIATLPQCKIKRNYACTKCSYYTQNPRSFLHHQKNVHAERLRVYECSHCLYASKHSQKLQRHVHMVHQNITISTAKDQGNVGSKSLLVPPVRIRMQRSTKRADQQLAELLIKEDIKINEVEESKIVRESVEEIEGEVVVSEETKDEPIVDDGSSSRPDPSPLTPPSPPRRLLYKKQHKQEKQSSTFIRCSVCAFGSHSQTLVNRHEKTAHLKKKFFRCMKCNYVTHMRARYTKHVKYHTMPMIKCDDCDFRTPYKWNLDRHNRNHSTTSPGTYRCMHCSFSADIKQSLTVHETNHHVPPVSGVFPAVVANRRRYRVGASDAPGSAVDGTEVCTKIDYF